MSYIFFFSLFFFFNDTATTEIYTLSLHDALPICAAESDLHVPRHGARDEQEVGVPGAGHEVDAEPLEIEHRIGRGNDLKLAPVAAPGVHLADVEGASEPPLDPLLQRRGRFLQARPRQDLHSPERGLARSAVDVESGPLCELLAR